MNNAVIEGRLTYPPFCSKISLKHLGFADDMLIFLKGEISSITALMDIFNEFYIMSGLKLNPNKTEIFIVGLAQEQIARII